MINLSPACRTYNSPYICREKLINRMDNAVVKNRVLILPKTFRLTYLLSGSLPNLTLAFAVPNQQLKLSFYVISEPVNKAVNDRLFC